MSISFKELINEFARRNAGTGGGGKKAKYVQKVSNTPVGFIQDRGKKGGEAVDKEKAAAAQKKQAKLDRIAAAKERAASK
jgi:hypothetical protein